MAPSDLENLMTAWACEVGEIAMGCYRQTGKLVFKTEHEVVTAADREIEHRLRELIAASFPDDLVVGEEMGGPARNEHGPQARVWHVDPIDGTLNFALGLPGFCTSLALQQD
jgi:fructose-1,6-bisphosphatase/inositol monophosphatase family enzyme